MPQPGPVCVGTWPFSLSGVNAAAKSLIVGGSALDAVELGINVVELDPEVTSVGYGGLPNCEGIVQMDATVMTGDMKAGGVLALEHCRTPISVARKVMEKTPHVLLSGAGASSFAQSEGFPKEGTLSPHAEQRWRNWRAGLDTASHLQPSRPPEMDPECHDTVGMICIDSAGHMAAGCSTSGWAFKLPGRIGDSPIIGSGLYCDESVGACVATGDGEQIMKFCLSFLVVELLRQGLSPHDACRTAIQRLVQPTSSSPAHNHPCQAAVLALDRHGNIGAYATLAGFTYAVWRAVEGSGEPSGEVVRVGVEHTSLRWDHVHPEGKDVEK